MTKKAETKEETKLTYDQQLLADIKYNESEIENASKDLEQLKSKLHQHIGALDYARYAYKAYMEVIEKNIETA